VQWRIRGTRGIGSGKLRQFSSRLRPRCLATRKALRRIPRRQRNSYAEIADRFAGTVSAEEALIRLGNLQYDGDKIEEAIEVFGRYLVKYPGGRFVVMAGVAKAYAEEKKGDLPGAEKTLKDVVERVKGIRLQGKRIQAWRIVYEVMKRPEDAVRVYGQIAEQFAQTHWAQNAIQRMSALKTK